MDMKWKTEISKEKLTDYLLSTAHPVGRSKANFFQALGFHKNSVTLLQKGLEEIAQSGQTVETIGTPYGLKQVIEGIIDTPSQKQVKIKTVWMESIPEKVLRFVTAYPSRKEK